MKKFLLILLCAVASAGAFAQDSKLTVNAGFLFPSTLNATVPIVPLPKIMLPPVVAHLAKEFDRMTV